VSRKYVSFSVFFAVWAELKGWTVPQFHLDICHWLEHRGRTGVLKVFRGAGKSTILALYQAWKLRDDPRIRFIDRSADDGTANKLSADTKNILMQHPLCKGMVKGKLGIERFSIIGNNDQRNASVTAYGILSNATSSRADEIINDDCEVPKNIKTMETRQMLRERLSEEVHIIVPGGKILYVGTDHTHNSIYDQKIKEGYDSLIIPLFAHHTRHEADGARDLFPVTFKIEDPDNFYVMIGRDVMKQDQYEIMQGQTGNFVRLKDRPTEGTVIDIYAGNPWPGYFDRDEIEFRRKECQTQNAWDSQYLLHAKPVHEIRLNPDRLVIYTDRPEINYANGGVSMYLGPHKMENCKAYWDCSLGKPDSDDSTFSVMFGDGTGHLYWQVLDVLQGDVYEQCRQILQRVEQYQLPGICIETNGPGGFLPAILRKALKEAGMQCGITEQHAKENKTKRILDAFEPPLSGQFLHCSRDVLESGLSDQMQDWRPGKLNQPDDLLDAGAGCISHMPVKIGRVIKDAPRPRERQEWQQAAGQGAYQYQTTF
jgi:hypothetical protein